MLYSIETLGLITWCLKRVATFGRVQIYSATQEFDRHRFWAEVINSCNVSTCNGCVHI